MRAVCYQRYGPPDVCSVRDLPRPEPRPGQVLVRVRAASLNDWDWANIAGDQLITRLLLGWRRPRIRIPGCDFAGTVEALGAGVQGLEPGARVFGDLSMAGFGTFAEYVCAPVDALAIMAPGMSFEQAAALPHAGLLALQALRAVGGLQAGQGLLLNGAGGGVGTIALQLAGLHDLQPAVVDSADKLDMLAALGAGELIDYRHEDFTRRGRSYDVIVDVKTNRSPFAYGRALAAGGVYATVGGSVPRLLQAAVVGGLGLLSGGRRIRVVSLKPNAGLDCLNGHFVAGRLRPVIDRTYPLADAVEALRRYGRAEQQGKIVLVME